MREPTGREVTGTPVVVVACCCCCLTCSWALGFESSPGEESPLLLSPPSWSLASCSASEMSGRTTPSEFEFSIWRNVRDVRVTWCYFGQRRQWNGQSNTEGENVWRYRELLCRTVARIEDRPDMRGRSCFRRTRRANFEYPGGKRNVTWHFILSFYCLTYKKEAIKQSYFLLVINYQHQHFKVFELQL